MLNSPLLSAVSSGVIVGIVLAVCFVLTVVVLPIVIVLYYKRGRSKSSHCNHEKEEEVPVCALTLICTYDGHFLCIAKYVEPVFWVVHLPTL